jgi:hypothetical protein
MKKNLNKIYVMLAVKIVLSFALYMVYFIGNTKTVSLEFSSYIVNAPARPYSTNSISNLSLVAIVLSFVVIIWSIFFIFVSYRNAKGYSRLLSLSSSLGTIIVFAFAIVILLSKIEIGNSIDYVFFIIAVCALTLDSINILSFIKGKKISNENNNLSENSNNKDPLEDVKHVLQIKNLQEELENKKEEIENIKLKNAQEQISNFETVKNSNTEW